jgi:hypothetical protein
MTSNAPENTAVRFVACYAVWLASLALLGVAAAQTNGLLLDVALLLRANQWVGRAVRQLSLPVLGLIWLIALYWLEWYLRTGVRKGLLRPRAIRALAVTGGALLVVLALRALV